ncbi:MAG: hypothetical protein PVI51_06785 [candidate division WOR-3 bacterium]|jgi:hypothetical protein
MRVFKYIALIGAVVAIFLGVVCRIFTGNNILFGLGGITYLRLTVVMLLFALTFHFLLPGN